MEQELDRLPPYVTLADAVNVWHGLTKVIGDSAPGAIKEQKLENYFGRKIAIDASMSVYQFMIAVRQQGAEGAQMLMNEAGEVTSHLTGIFHRTIRMMESGLKPVYVFDGKPPTLKSGELAKRAEVKAKAEEKQELAQEEGAVEEADKYSKRTTKITREHFEECKRLLRLMGIPVVEAPCEAESQCAALCKAGKVFATATEDMDALTYGSPVLLRHLTFSEARKIPVMEFGLARIHEDMGLTSDEFIDLCILLGCDYCGTIRNIGPKKALDLIKKYHGIEEILKHVDVTKNKPSDDFTVRYTEVRDIFKYPEVTDPETIELKWNPPDEEGIVKFLVEEKGFNEDRVRRAVDKLKASKATSTQGRLETFFGAPTLVKRKADPSKDPKGKKAKPGPNKGKGRK